MTDLGDIPFTTDVYTAAEVDALIAGGGGGGSSLGWFNVKDPIYGATGDGTTDDSAAIQAAIDDAVNADFAGIGGTVYFPNGKYYVETGLVSTLAGVSFIGEGSPGSNSSIDGTGGLAGGDTQIQVGDGQWGLKIIPSDASGHFRGTTMRNLQFYEVNPGEAQGGVWNQRNSNSLFEHCAFGEFSKSVKTTFNGTPGALSTLGTLTLTSATGWPTAGTGYIETVAGASGSDYHWFRYTGVAGSTLTGVTYQAPTTDTVAAGAEIGALVGVGFLNDGLAVGESAMNKFSDTTFGRCTFAWAQIGLGVCFFSNCVLDGCNNNPVTQVVAGSRGMFPISGGFGATGGYMLGYDIHIDNVRGNSGYSNFLHEGWITAAYIQHQSPSTNKVYIGGEAHSNVAGSGPAVIIKPGVENTIVAMRLIDEEILDQGTGTIYPHTAGDPRYGPSVVGTIVGSVPFYDHTGTVVGLAALYDTITGAYKVRNLITAVQMNSVVGGGVTSIAHTISASVAVGDLIVIRGGYGQGTTRTITPSDTQGNAWQVDRHDDKTTGAAPHSFIASCSVTNALEPGDTITVTFSGVASLPVASVDQYSGVPTSSWVDAVIGATGTSATPDSGNLTTAADQELLVASLYYAIPSPNTGAAGTGYSVDDGPYTMASTKVLLSESRNSGTAGSWSAGATLGSSVEYAISLAAIKRA